MRSHQPRLQRRKQRLQINSFSRLSVNLGQRPGRLPLAPTFQFSWQAHSPLFRGQFLFSVLGKKVWEIWNVFCLLAVDQEASQRQTGSRAVHLVLWHGPCYFSFEHFDFETMTVMGWIVSSTNPYVEVLLPRTSEYNLLWKIGSFPGVATVWFLTTWFWKR